MSQPINLRCPKCEKQNAFSVSSSESNNSLICENCKTSFRAWIVKIRAKHSRQDKRANSRTYSVRVIDVTGREDLIEFSQVGIADFELRSGDLAAFSYIGDKLQIIQNLTIGRYLSLKSGGSKVALITCLVLVGLLIVLCALGTLLTKVSSRQTPTPAALPTPTQEASPTVRKKRAGAI